MKKFQLIILVICGAVAVIAVLIFAGYIPSPVSKKSAFKGSGSVVIWGTENKPEFITFMNDLAGLIPDYTIKYQYHPKETYVQDLIEAFANNSSPDLFFVDDQNLLRLQDKVTPIPYATLPKSNFVDGYVPAARIFLGQEGTYALPLLVDPIVLYYNRTLLASEGLVNPPLYWDEFVGLSEKLNKRDETGFFLQSTLPFGRFENNPYAKDIISTLLLQVANPIVYQDQTMLYVTDLATHTIGSKSSLALVMEFFTDFSSPEKNVYSWNKALPDATSAFLTEQLAFLVAPASKLFTIRDTNPNLSFGVTEIPGPRNIKTKRIYSHVTGLALSKNSPNPKTAMLALGLITNKDNATNIATVFSLPSVYMENLKTNTDPSSLYTQTFQSSVIKSISWLDPSNTETTNIFKELSVSILAGGIDTEGNYDRAESRLRALLDKYNQAIQIKNSAKVNTSVDLNSIGQ